MCNVTPQADVITHVLLPQRCMQRSPPKQSPRADVYTQDEHKQWVAEYFSGKRSEATFSGDRISEIQKLHLARLFLVKALIDRVSGTHTHTYGVTHNHTHTHALTYTHILTHTYTHAADRVEDIEARPPWSAPSPHYSQPQR